MRTTASAAATSDSLSNLLSAAKPLSNYNLSFCCNASNVGAAISRLRTIDTVNVIIFTKMPMKSQPCWRLIAAPTLVCATMEQNAKLEFGEQSAQGVLSLYL